MDYSVVIPLYNERDSLAPLHVELTRVMQSLGRAYELIFVDDGSVDGSLDALRQIKSTDNNVRVIALARNSGQTAALACGFSHANGDVVIAMDADGEIGFRPRRARISKYGLWRIVSTLLGLITVKFLSGYSTAPIQVFGLIGIILGGLGSLWTFILVMEKILLGHELGNRPALLLAVLLVVVGVQFVSIGLLGEMLARTYHESQGKPIYVIREEF